MTARKFREMKDAPPEFLLQIIPLIRQKDPQLAAELWQQVRERVESNAGLAAAAAFQAFGLDMEDQATDLLKQALQAAGQPDAPLKPMTLEQFINLSASQRQEQSELYKLYERGQAPIQLVAARLDCPLVRFFHETVRQNQDTQATLLAEPLFARHGSQTQQRLTTWDHVDQNIFIDVTSLLLAETIGLLDSAEQHFKTIHVSGHLTASLIRQITSLEPKQPRRLRDTQHVLHLLDANKILSI